jgi:hypothetical protein
MTFLLTIYQGKPKRSPPPYHDMTRTMVLALSTPTFALFNDLSCEMIELEDDIHLEMNRKGEAADKWSVVNRVAVVSRQRGVTRRWWWLEKKSAVAVTAGDVGQRVGGERRLKMQEVGKLDRYHIGRMRMAVQSYAKLPIAKYTREDFTNKPLAKGKTMKRLYILTNICCRDK